MGVSKSAIFSNIRFSNKVPLCKFAKKLRFLEITFEINHRLDLKNCLPSLEYFIEPRKAKKKKKKKKNFVKNHFLR